MHSRSIFPLAVILLVLIATVTSVAFITIRPFVFAKSKTTDCPATSTSSIVTIALTICNGKGKPINGWPGSAIVPYVYGGGHNPAMPGPDTGNKSSCKPNQECGVDCSGFVRWVYYLAYNGDVLKAKSKHNESNTDAQLSLYPSILQKRASSSDAQPGDIVFFYPQGGFAHNGIYIGSDQMIDSPRTGANIRKESVSGFGTVRGYYYIPVPQLASSYAGITHSNGPIEVTADFGLNSIQEDQQGNFSGQAAGGDGPFTGTINSNDSINFTIKSAINPPNLLIFTGTAVTQNSAVNSMSGTYTVEDPSDPAGAATGTWQASPGTCGTGC